MSISDQDFREQFKPLHIPAHYIIGDSEQNKIVFALANIGVGTPKDIANELFLLDPMVDIDHFNNVATKILQQLFNKGLIKGIDLNGETHYNLSKITEANDGEVNPDLLAPGLD